MPMCWRDKGATSGYIERGLTGRYIIRREHLFQTIYIMYMADTNLDLVRASPQATCQHTAVTDEKGTTANTRDTAKEDI